MFTYALLVLRTVRSSYEDNDRFVPALSVTVAVVLALVSVGFLIYFMNHVARSMQAEVVLDRAAVNARRVVEELFTEQLPFPIGSESLIALLETALDEAAWDSFSRGSAIRRAGRVGFARNVRGAGQLGVARCSTRAHEGSR